MSWRDRDYYKEESWTGARSSGMAFRRPPVATAVLMALHVLVGGLLWVTSQGEPPDAISLAAFSFSEQNAPLLAIVLHPFASHSVISLLLSVLIVWMLGGHVERQRGARAMLGMYVVGNLLAGVAFFAVAHAWSPLGAFPLDYPAGALGAWAVAAVRPMWGEMVMVFGKPQPVSQVACISGAIAAGVMVALHRFGAVGWVSAVVAGSLGETLLAWLPALPARRRGPRIVRPSISHEPPPDETPFAEPTPEDEVLDELLAKISRSGIESLTDEERARLEAARRAKLRRVDSTS